MRLYWAAPLFSQLERKWNRAVAEALAKELPGWDVILPQDFKVEEQYNKRAGFGKLFQACIDNVAKAHLVVAVLDGADADAGVAFEMGYAFAKKIPVIGVRTDFRENQERGVNLMLSRGCSRMVTAPSFNEDDSALARLIARSVKQHFKADNRK